MIEVLLAIVVLAIGLLAGSRMQILGLNYTQGAMTTSYATMAASDILDRMRLNPDGMSTYDGFTTENNAPGAQNCEANGCDAVQRANEDLRIWSRYFRGADAGNTSTLMPPGAVGKIDVVSGVTQVKISWSDLISGKNDAQEITIGAEL